MNPYIAENPEIIAARQTLHVAMELVGLTAHLERRERERYCVAVARGETPEHTHTWAPLSEGRGAWCPVCGEVLL